MVVPPKYNGMSVAALVLGIVGIVLDCGAFFIPSLLAIIFGAVSKKQIEQSIGRQRGKEFANAGLIMGIIGVAICVLFWLFILVFMTSVFSTVNYSSNFDGGTNAVIGSFLFNRF
jgi:hypothetical protein